MFHVDSKQVRSFDLVTVSGRIDASAATPLAEKLKSITSEGRFRIVVDLSEADYLSVGGIRALLLTLKDCASFNRGYLRLVLPTSRRNKHDKVWRALELAGDTELFRFLDTVDEAVLSS